MLPCAVDSVSTCDVAAMTDTLVEGRSGVLSQGDPVVLPCTIDSVPVAEISWLQNAQPLPANPR